MDPATRGHVVAVFRWLASELQKDQHPLAHVPSELARVVADGGPRTECKRCGGPVERVRVGRPRVVCESCRPPRRSAAPKPDKSAS